METIYEEINELDSLNSTINFKQSNEEDIGGIKMYDIEVNIKDIVMDDNEVDDFFKLLNETVIKIQETTKEGTLNIKKIKEILYTVVLLYMNHSAIFQYLFLKYRNAEKNAENKYVDRVKIYDIKTTNIEKIKEYYKLYATLNNLLIFLQTSEQLLQTSEKKYIDACSYMFSELYNSYIDINNKNIELSNFTTDPSKYKVKGEYVSIDAEIEKFKKNTKKYIELTKTKLKELNLIITGGRKKPTKPKPKGKHDNMTMKDIKELCKANQIKLSRVVEGECVVYKKKELLAKLLDAKIANAKPSDGHKKPTKPKPKHDDMTMKDINELCKANQIKLSRVVEGKHIVYNKKELLAKLLDAKIANAKPSDGHKKPTKPKPKHDDMTMKDIKELCKANQIKLSRVVEGKHVVYNKKELITKLKRKKLL